MALLRDTKTGQEHLLRQPSTVLGRAGDCDLVLTQSRVSARY